MKYMHRIPYGRNSDRADFRLVLKENKGTCGTKHAFMRAIADLNGVSNVKLVIGIYRMNQYNTPKIGPELRQNGVSYFPEAHVYLRILGKRIDLTRSDMDFEQMRSSILAERVITPEQIGAYKMRFHKTYLRKWLTKTQLKFSLEELWAMRERCIAHLSD